MPKARYKYSDINIDDKIKSYGYALQVKFVELFLNLSTYMECNDFYAMLLRSTTLKLTKKTSGSQRKETYAIRLTIIISRSDK